MRHLYLMAIGAILVMLPAHAQQTVITASTQASEISIGKYLFYYFEYTTRQLQLSDVQEI